MHKPEDFIYYKVPENDTCYGIKILENNTTEDTDMLLDSLNPNDVEFTTQEEFENKYEKTMYIDIMDKDSVRFIGVLRTKHIPEDEMYDGIKI